MKTKKRKRGLFFLLAVLAAAACLLTGCGAQKSEAQEDAETIQVYLWNTTLYENYAPYIQSQLPDVNIEFIVGNNDLDFYKFLNENGGLPDIITCCRFSLHDAAPASLVVARFIRLSFSGAASCSEKRQQVMMSGRPPFSFRNL